MIYYLLTFLASYSLPLHLWSHLVLYFCLLEDILLLIQIHYWLLIRSFCLFLPDSVWGDCSFLGIYPILLGCPFYCHITVCSGLLWSYVFLQGNISLFISDFIYPGPLFSWWVWLYAYQFYLFKELALNLIDLFYGF